MFKKRYLRTAAFTLVEVLVVTTIMTSQANNYGNVTRLAYQKTCESNLRQLYMAFQMYDINNGALPQAKFYPKNPKKDPQSLYNVLPASYRPLLVCPVYPPAIKDKGLTYIYNDNLAGRSLGLVRNPRETWLLTEMNAVYDEIPLPHPGGFHILYCDGHIEVTKEPPTVFKELREKIAAELEKQKKGSGEGSGDDSEDNGGQNAE